MEKEEKKRQSIRVGEEQQAGGVHQKPDFN